MRFFVRFFDKEDTGEMIFAHDIEDAKYQVIQNHPDAGRVILYEMREVDAWEQYEQKTVPPTDLTKGQDDSTLKLGA